MSAETKDNSFKGHILKRTREEKGLSLENVHEETKIPMDVLRGIEEGYRVRVITPFYYRGFLKIYASFLGVDMNQVLDVPPKKHIPPKPVEFKEPESFEWLQSVKGFWTRKRKQQIVAIIGGLLAVFIVFKILGFLGKMIFKGKSSKAPAAMRDNRATAEQQEQEQAKKIERAVARQEEAKKKAEAVSKAQQQEAPSRIVLSIRAKEDSWLRVKVDGEIVFQAILRTGSAETWKAAKEVEISGRHLSQLEFELNGKLIGTLGRQDRRAKKVIITKDGLSVTK